MSETENVDRLLTLRSQRVKLVGNRTLQQRFEIEFNISARCQTTFDEVRRIVLWSGIHAMFHRGCVWQVRLSVDYFQ